MIADPDLDAVFLATPTMEHASQIIAALEGGKHVFSEKPTSLNLDDCLSISRALSDVLDAEETAGRDPIEGGYRLEVSSPGIDRPLTRAADYRDWAGHEARIKLGEPLAGAKQLSGTIEGIENNIVTIATPKGAREVPLKSIASAKLLLTDKLINATAPISSEGAYIIRTEG